MRTQKLNEIADIFRGKVIKQYAEDGEIGVLGISNITDTGVDYTGMKYISGSTRKLSPYEIKNGDIILAVRGNIIKSALVEDLPGVCIPTSNICVIRAEGDIRPDYLQLYLSSPMGMEQLQAAHHAKEIPHLNPDDLRNLCIPIADEHVELAETYSRDIAAYRDGLKSARDTWRKALENMYAQIGDSKC